MPVGLPAGTVFAVTTDIDLKTFAELANDENMDMREHVAKNPTSPKEVLVKLADGKDEVVRNAARR